MKKKLMIIALMLAMAIQFVQAVAINEISYSIKMRFDGHNALPESAKLVQGEAAEEDRTENHSYKLQLTSFKGEKLDSRGFDLPNYWFDIDVYVENGTFIMFLPYHTNGQKLEVYRNGRKISELDVSEFASCNQDGFCSVTEKQEECPEDCKVKVVEEKTSEAKEEKTTVIKEKPLSPSLVATIVILLLVLAALIYFATRKGAPKKR